MTVRRKPKLVAALFVAALVIALPAFADELKGKIKSIDRSRSEIVVTDEKSERDVTASLSALNKGLSKTDALKNLKDGTRITVDNAFLAARITLDDEKKGEEGSKLSVIEEFWHNFTHNLFKPLLLFFYLGFLVPILRVEFEFPYVIYQGLTVSRLRHQGMDPLGNTKDEPGYDPNARPLTAHLGEPGHAPSKHDREVEKELELSLEKLQTPHVDYGNGDSKKKPGLISGKLLHEVFLDTGLYLLFGGIIIGLISGLQGKAATRDDDNFFVSLFQGVLAVPAVQRPAIPEASPTLPLAASLGLTFSYNVTIGIPVYIVIAQQVMRAFPVP